MSVRCKPQPLICPFPEGMFDAWYRPILMRQGHNAAIDAIIAVLDKRQDFSLAITLNEMGEYVAGMHDPLRSDKRGAR